MSGKEQRAGYMCPRNNVSKILMSLVTSSEVGRPSGSTTVKDTLDSSIMDI